jgi:hypothetical protein
MIRLRYAAEMTIGALCYVVVMVWPHPWGFPLNRFLEFCIGWAGVFAYSDGFQDWRHTRGDLVKEVTK